MKKTTTKKIMVKPHERILVSILFFGKAESMIFLEEKTCEQVAAVDLFSPGSTAGGGVEWAGNRMVRMSKRAGIMVDDVR
ncbi:MAG: hypothetical protein ACE15F_08055 [bacterium]